MILCKLPVPELCDPAFWVGESQKQHKAIMEFLLSARHCQVKKSRDIRGPLPRSQEVHSIWVKRRYRHIILI